MEPDVCPECHGTGMVDSAMPSLIADVYDLRCYWCDGSGVKQGDKLSLILKLQVL